mmetsp:Transcript_33901/g.84983  ORF Transcript_33901/g.84983 Transcript_33901/m.84983 type:complete len:458 (+) Transcript_33901:334-1707(+)
MLAELALVKVPAVLRSAPRSRVMPRAALTGGLAASRPRGQGQPLGPQRLYHQQRQAVGSDSCGPFRHAWAPRAPTLRRSYYASAPLQASTAGVGTNYSAGRAELEAHRECLWTKDGAVPLPLPLPQRERALHPALELVVERARNGSKPGCRTDPFKLGLVVEGGGMRGCVSAGMLIALYDLGLRGVFDSVYGSSAGAINLTYFLSGQREGVDIYADMLSNGDFIDLSRLFKRRAGPVLDLSFLLDTVMRDMVPLRWDSVLRSEIPLKAVASCVRKLRPVVLDQFADEHDLLTCLRASANVPGIAGSPIEHRGHSLVDAAIFEPIPFPAAIADGCTHVLVLCSRPDPTQLSVGPIRSRLNSTLAEVVRKAVLSPAYMKPAWETRFEQEITLGMSVDDILFASMDEGGPTLPIYSDSHMYSLLPGPAAALAPLCTNTDTIRAGVREGSATVYRTFQGLL